MKRFFCCFLVFASSCLSMEPVILLCGPPGSGKGTFSQYLKSHFRYIHLSVGDLSRREIELQTPLGLQIQDIVRQGGFMDRNLYYSLVEQQMIALQPVIDQPLILDGFIRKPGDAIFLKDLLDRFGISPRAVLVFLEADDDLCIYRMLHRLICSSCGAVYNFLQMPPLVEGQCDVCSGSLIHRLNDVSEVIEKRVREYRQDSAIMQPLAASLFPSFCFQQHETLTECLQDYEEFAKKIQRVSTAQEFLFESPVEVKAENS